MSCYIFILEDLYEHHVATFMDVDDAHVAYHIACTLRSHLLVLVGTLIFMEKSVTYVNVIYLGYFIDLDIIQKYN